MSSKRFYRTEKITREQLQKEVLDTLISVGYNPIEIEFGKPNKGVVSEIRVPVLFDEKEAMRNWHNKYDKN